MMPSDFQFGELGFDVIVPFVFPVGEHRIVAGDGVDAICIKGDDRVSGKFDRHGGNFVFMISLREDCAGSGPNSVWGDVQRRCFEFSFK